MISIETIRNAKTQLRVRNEHFLGPSRETDVVTKATNIDL